VSYKGYIYLYIGSPSDTTPHASTLKTHASFVSNSGLILHPTSTSQAYCRHPLRPEESYDHNGSGSGIAQLSATRVLPPSRLLGTFRSANSPRHVDTHLQRLYKFPHPDSKQGWLQLRRAPLVVGGEVHRGSFGRKEQRRRLSKHLQRRVRPSMKCIPPLYQGLIRPTANRLQLKYRGRP